MAGEGVRDVKAEAAEIAETRRKLTRLLYSAGLGLVMAEDAARILMVNRVGFLPDPSEAAVLENAMRVLAANGYRVEPAERTEIPFELRAAIRAAVTPGGVSLPGSQDCEEETCRNCGCRRVVQIVEDHLRNKGWRP